MRRKWTDEQLIQAVKDSRSVAQVIEKLGLKPAGGNYKTINTKIAELGLDVSHFKGQGWNTGEDYKPIKEAIPLEKILVKDSNYQSYKLAKRLLKEGLKEHKCEKCGNTEWLGEAIPLELHHINGDHTDNRIENLQMLCPNCHAFTDNYRGKNIGMSAPGETQEVEAG